jgi:hypothetical protein
MLRTRWSERKNKNGKPSLAERLENAASSSSGGGKVGRRGRDVTGKEGRRESAAAAGEESTKTRMAEVKSRKESRRVGGRAKPNVVLRKSERQRQKKVEAEGAADNYEVRGCCCGG